VGYFGAQWLSPSAGVSPGAGCGLELCAEGEVVGRRWRGAVACSTPDATSRSLPSTFWLHASGAITGARLLMQTHSENDHAPTSIDLALRTSVRPQEGCERRGSGRGMRPAVEGVGVHTLRHSAAVSWLEARVHIKAVADLLGHSSIAITGDVYGHTSDDTARAAVDGLAARLGM
jgi:Phage integrase family